MKKILVSIVILLVFVTSCAPGSDLEVTTPESTIELRSPDPTLNSVSRMMPAVSRASCKDSGMGSSLP